MSLDFIAEVWDALRTHIDITERKEAADTLVNLLIDSGFESDEIKDSFRNDKEINGALKYYREQHESEEEYEEDFDEDEDDEW
jgi:uncharacterized protein (DUF433 family)